MTLLCCHSNREQENKKEEKLTDRICEIQRFVFLFNGELWISKVNQSEKDRVTLTLIESKSVKSEGIFF